MLKPLPYLPSLPHRLGAMMCLKGQARTSYDETVRDLMDVFSSPRDVPDLDMDDPEVQATASEILCQELLGVLDYHLIQHHYLSKTMSDQAEASRLALLGRVGTMKAWILSEKDILSVNPHILVWCLTDHFTEWMNQLPIRTLGELHHIGTFLPPQLIPFDMVCYWMMKSGLQPLVIKALKQLRYVPLDYHVPFSARVTVNSFKVELWEILSRASSDEFRHGVTKGPVIKLYYTTPPLENVVREHLCNKIAWGFHKFLNTRRGEQYGKMACMTGILINDDNVWDHPTMTDLNDTHAEEIKVIQDWLLTPEEQFPEHLSQHAFLLGPGLRGGICLMLQLLTRIDLDGFVDLIYAKKKISRH